MLALNPVLDESLLQGGAVFNSLLLAYLGTAGLLWLIARSLSLINMEQVPATCRRAGRGSCDNLCLA